MSFNITRDQAYDLVSSWTPNQNLIKHMLAVEAIMSSLADHFHEDKDLYSLAGLLHDADYETFKDQPQLHPSKILDELKSRQVDDRIITAIAAHAWGWQDSAPQPSSNLDWSLYISDELSGLIIATALVMPDKKLASVGLDSVLKKFKDKTFAKGVHRDHILLCQEKLDLPLNDFLTLALLSLQNISTDLGL